MTNDVTRNSIMSLVILDLGGVLFNIDFDKTRRALLALSGYNGHPIEFGLETQSDVFVAYDSGDISTIEFRKELRSMFGYTCTDDELDKAWCAILNNGLYESATDLVGSARSRYASAAGDRLVIFSNISELHYLDAMVRCKPVFELVDHVYLSYVLRLRKPDPKAFLTVCNSEGALPGSTTLIDDSTANCESARALGITAIRITPGNPVLP